MLEIAIANFWSTSQEEWIAAAVVVLCAGVILPALLYGLLCSFAKQQKNARERAEIERYLLMASPFARRHPWER